MRTRGAGVLIASEYQGVSGPVVKVQFLAKADFTPQEYYRRLAAYVGYLGQSGKGEHGDEAEYFGPEGEAIDLDTFYPDTGSGRHTTHLAEVLHSRGGAHGAPGRHQNMLHDSADSGLGGNRRAYLLYLHHSYADHS